MPVPLSILFIILYGVSAWAQLFSPLANHSTFMGLGPFPASPPISNAKLLQSQPAINLLATTGNNPPCIYTGDMKMIDRRIEEGWFNLYPFGERYNDVDMSVKPWKELQIDLDFYFPFYGFRYNYTFINPGGFVAFNRPQFIQPPFTYPNPNWPEEPDPSFIAAFLTEQTLAHVGDTKLSHVWYRVLTTSQLTFRSLDSQAKLQPGLQSYTGRVEDPELLIQISRDIQEGMVGARGFMAQFALLVTWERMGYGGQPKFLRLDQCRQFKKWLNTYQLVLATEEIRSYVLFNYAHINYTSSVSAGAWNGRGGRQSALVGVNGGNGTGFWPLPYSAQGDSFKLVLYGSTETAGRWLARVDEIPQYGGCSNASDGVLTLDIPYTNMIGGRVFNVSGPCFRPTDHITMEIDEEIFDCAYVNMVKATCVIPFNAIFKTGFVTIQVAQDGRNYAWRNNVYIYPPSLGTPGQVTLVNSIRDTTNAWQPDWHKYDVENLTIHWQSSNISTLPNSQLEISLYGYWEDVMDREFMKIGTISTGVPNTGVYTFNPKLIPKTDMLMDSWRKFSGGSIQIQVTNFEKHDRGDKLLWSKLIPFGWYFQDIWAKEYGSDWTLQMCVEWFDNDGRRDNFMMELENDTPCPCMLNQAEADFGRFLPLPQCDMYGDSSCFYNKGAQHCVVSASPTLHGASQVCCYDFNGWLMFSQDYEYNREYLRFGSAGVPYRAHPWGGYRYKKPPHVPSWSNFYNDLLPYDICCRWAGRCEFYYWRRISSGCENYKSVALGTAYGHGHYITFDNTKFTFNGRGYFTLLSYQAPGYDFKVQIRTEQPPKTLYNTMVQATVITGVAMRDNGSSLIEVYSRKEFRRWRYKTDLYMDGRRVFTDDLTKKIQHFNRVTLRSPHMNMNSSELDFLFKSGVGVRVIEANGYLQIIIALPSSYYESQVTEEHILNSFLSHSRCTMFHRTTGLFGPYNGDPSDDLTSPTCQILPIQGRTADDLRLIYNEFGEKWRVNNSDLLFNRVQAPLYYPNSWKFDLIPSFNPWQDYTNLDEERLIFNRQTEVGSTCQDVFSCEYDFLVTGRREDALVSLSAEKKFEGLKQRGEQKLISCGPLQKNDGVLKHPIGQNYLDGVTVTFSCKVEYFLHGSPSRTCRNGTWTPGWWNWCRSRTEEYALRWVTGLTAVGGVVALLAGVFYLVYRARFGRGQRWRRFQTETDSPQRRGSTAGEQVESIRRQNSYHSSTRPIRRMPKSWRSMRRYARKHNRSTEPFSTGLNTSADPTDLSTSGYEDLPDSHDTIPPIDRPLASSCSYYNFSSSETFLPTLDTTGRLSGSPTLATISASVPIGTAAPEETIGHVIQPAVGNGINPVYAVIRPSEIPRYTESSF